MNNNQEQEASRLFDELATDIQQCYDHKITAPEAAQAARNLIGFCRTLVAMRRAKG